MGTLRRRRRLSLSVATVALLLLIASASALAVNPTRGFFSVGVRKIGEEVMARRRLGGPGSWPPTCRSKCGRCAPCKPVHVPIQPGFSMPLEYYPEAWRCKCGDKLFLP
ncbi:EPIDERMAL PATTERNING FACTOR-like protein 4 [Sesamum alatum]|uniref:Epidermal patterning factor-like protein n=1 Tax=Sesamum alatum TaxID=300844 RepID=A0AAE1YPK9_9LAMI|nr:EPIDERMAL PATTERNING FACTOR-like protein 4 [Sesamum alatum]